MQSGLLLCILRPSSAVSSPFRSILALVESAIGRTCLSDAVGHLSIENVGRAEAATTVGEGVTIVEDLTIDFISGMFAVDPFSLLDAHCKSKALSGHRQGIFESLKVTLRVSNDITVIGILEVTNK